MKFTRTFSLLTLALGGHVLTVSAIDAAGNPAAQTVTFRIVATVDSLIAAVNVFAGQQQMDDALRRSFLAKLEDAKQSLARSNSKVAINKLLLSKNAVIRTGNGGTLRVKQLFVKRRGQRDKGRQYAPMQQCRPRCRRARLDCSAR